jgi:hypothetical protein
MRSVVSLGFEARNNPSYEIGLPCGLKGLNDTS